MAKLYFCFLFILKLTLVAGQAEYYVLKGKKVILTPSLPGRPGNILWKHNGDKVITFDGAEEQVFERYEERVELDWSTAKLSIAKVSFKDSGEYELDAIISQRLHRSQYMLKVLDEVSSPSISCKKNDESSNSENITATLFCSSESDTPEALTYKWDLEGKSHLDQALPIVLGNEHDDITYSCTVKSRLQEETNVFMAKDCFTEKMSGDPKIVVPVVIVSILLLLLCIIIFLFLLKRKKRACFNRRVNEDIEKELKTAVQKRADSVRTKDEHDPLLSKDLHRQPTMLSPQTLPKQDYLDETPTSEGRKSATSQPASTGSSGPEPAPQPKPSDLLNEEEAGDSDSNQDQEEFQDAFSEPQPQRSETDVILNSPSSEEEQQSSGQTILENKSDEHHKNHDEEQNMDAAELVEPSSSGSSDSEPAPQLEQSVSETSNLPNTEEAGDSDSNHDSEEFHDLLPDQESQSSPEKRQSDEQIDSESDERHKTQDEKEKDTADPSGSILVDPHESDEGSTAETTTSQSASPGSSDPEPVLQPEQKVSGEETKEVAPEGTLSHSETEVIQSSPSSEEDQLNDRQTISENKSNEQQNNLDDENKKNAAELTDTENETYEPATSRAASPGSSEAEPREKVDPQHEDDKADEVEDPDSSNSPENIIMLPQESQNGKVLGFYLRSEEQANQPLHVTVSSSNQPTHDKEIKDTGGEDANNLTKDGSDKESDSSGSEQRNEADKPKEKLQGGTVDGDNCRSNCVLRPKRQEVILSPSLPGRPGNILWKHNGDKVITFNGAEEQVFERYEERVELDWSTAKLSITKVSFKDSGEYELDAIIGQKFHRAQYMLKVLDEVSSPSISCKKNDESSNSENITATLFCSSESDTPEALTYKWDLEGKSHLDQALPIVLGNEHDDITYSCTVKSHLQEETSVFTAKGCYTVQKRADSVRTKDEHEPLISRIFTDNQQCFHHNQLLNKTIWIKLLKVKEGDQPHLSLQAAVVQSQHLNQSRRFQSLVSFLRRGTGDSDSNHDQEEFYDPLPGLESQFSPEKRQSSEQLDSESDEHHKTQDEKKKDTADPSGSVLVDPDESGNVKTEAHTGLDEEKSLHLKLHLKAAVNQD
ncbi:hypothetical protein WMY93_002558 [Mugilogobius chulae]|uniref:Ig-like domain-containing protein n=1 Tax=Mugilogobius chulae TaxID=88201 RepID=A0AAW0Q3Z4_9GOBI